MNNDKVILIIEDEPAIRLMIRDVLEIHGYNVATASNGKEAMDFVTRANHIPSLILLDLMMPEMNGWQFLDFHKSIPELSEVPVVVCSAYKESAKAIKPSAIVEKPVQLDTLLTTVKAFCA